MKKNNSGYTLIEMMVVVGVMGAIMVVVTSTLLSAFKAKSRTEVMGQLQQNGNYVMEEIRNNFLKSDGKNVVCSGNSVTFINRMDGEQIQLVCNEGFSIASVSAAIDKNLTVGVTATGCGSFFSCERGTDGEVTAANISFTLSAGVPESGVENSISKSFSAKVAVRK